jgi:hypothetical protein
MLLDLLRKEATEKTKGGFGHVWQNKAHQMTTRRTKSCIQVAELITHLHAAQRAASPSAPPCLTLGAGATTHLVFIIDGLSVSLL